MEIDHIFIFTNDNGNVANELVAFGLIEGSSRVHVGQGTTNRKFYFQNFFLEILWVHNEIELNSEQTKPTGLWQRANYNNNNFSPLGMCMVNSDDSQKLFEKSFKYKPDYFMQGMTIDIIKNDQQPDLPWTFRLPFKVQNKNENEPKNHSNGIAVLTKTIVEYKSISDTSFLETFKSEDKIQFEKSTRNWLTLMFDFKIQGKSHEFEKLNLTIEY